MTGIRSWRTWSCTVRLVVDDARHLDAAAADLQALLDRIDRAVSRFRDDSALSLANRRAGRPVPVPAELIEFVDVALGAAEQTGGLLDPTIGLLLRQWGYDRDIDEVPLTGPAVQWAPGRSAANWRRVRIDRAAGLLTVPPRAALDLGATAKAHTADIAARMLAARYGTPVLVELGGDLAVAGMRADGWPVQIAEHESGDGQVVMLHRGGLATSTTTIRRWHRGGRDIHHVIDPRTGTPADEHWRTVTVAATTALAANTASTAVIVLGARAEQWLTGRGLTARLVARDGAVQTVGRWPDEHMRVAS